MPSQLSHFQRRQLEVIVRGTPHAMAGHILNTIVLAVALAGAVPAVQLIALCGYSCAVASVVLYRHARNRLRVPRNFRRAARRVAVYAVFLSLPWAGATVLYTGAVGHNEELIIVALVAGMAASGAILLSAIPAAAFSYMSAILIPGAAKCFFLVNQKGYVLLGILALSYWGFLAALISRIAGDIKEREKADAALEESEARLQEALTAGQVVAFTWEPGSGVSRHSENASQVLGFEVIGFEVPGTEAKAESHGRPGDFLAHVHPDDRACLAAQIDGLCVENPSYSTSFRFIRPDGREVWLEETGKAEFDAAGHYLRLKGLTRDITGRKRAEEQQRMLVSELDHRVKNVLASVATVARRTREDSGSMDEFLSVFDGRIQSMANAHRLLSQSHWQGVSLAALVGKELAPCVGEGSACVEGPEVLLSAKATQSMAIVLHELVTNALKYGALATKHGRISVRWDWQWDSQARRRLLLEWVEISGSPIVPPSHAGYGTFAIRNLIPHELGGAVDLAFDAATVRCRIELPSSALG
jgi:two-component sensor histidine kinase